MFASYTTSKADIWLVHLCEVEDCRLRAVSSPYTDEGKHEQLHGAYLGARETQRLHQAIHITMSSCFSYNSSL
jgi:hypothetical protein